MFEYIDVPFAVALSIALAWTLVFSLSSTPGIRGWRNLGILASYVIAIIFLFLAGIVPALVTWALFGIVGGIVYVLWELLQRFRTPPGEAKTPVSLSPLVDGLYAWPIMVPEAIEYALAELGMLSTGPSNPAIASDVEETSSVDATEPPPETDESH